MGKNKHIPIEIAYAKPDFQIILKINVDKNTTIKDAILQSKILEQIPDINFDNLNEINVGIYGKIKSLEYILQENDRIEIYRPLKIDPKQARKLRAKKHPIKKKN